jgi:protein involved in polysaccharide export with SLBB domain
MLGAATLAGAVVVGSRERLADASPERSPGPPPFGQVPDRGGSAASPASAAPGIRTEKSRRTDVSIASRYRREGVVHVGGQVSRPGPIRFLPGLTVSQAIQAAGGVTPFGSLRRVKVYRSGKLQSYDLSTESSGSIPLLPDDTIEIPERVLFGR